MKTTASSQTRRDRVRIKTDGKFWTASIRELKVAAAAGDPESQCTLGYLHGKGRGVPLSRKKALEYYREAARQGHVIATCNIALCYFNAWGVREDLKQAFKFWRKAALKGDHQSQRDLGIMYRFGEGIRRNRKLALHWLRRAARANDSEAMYHLADGHVNAGNLVVARRYMTRAAALGHAKAKRWLAKSDRLR